MIVAAIACCRPDRCSRRFFVSSCCWSYAFSAFSPSRSWYDHSHSSKKWRMTLCETVKERERETIEKTVCTGWRQILWSVTFPGSHNRFLDANFCPNCLFGGRGGGVAFQVQLVFGKNSLHFNYLFSPAFSASRQRKIICICLAELFDNWFTCTWPTCNFVHLFVSDFSKWNVSCVWLTCLITFFA